MSCARRYLGRLERRIRCLPLLLFFLPLGTAPGWAAPSVVVDLAEPALVLRIDADSTADQPGTGIASCDIDGDGLLDIAIGDWRANGVDNLRVDCGETSVIRGKRKKWLTRTSVSAARNSRIVGQEPFDQLGLRVACGDLNSDGKADLVLGAYSADGRGNGFNQAGQIHLVFGTNPLPQNIDLLTNPGTVIYGGVAGETLGNNPACGDVNGDGTVDLIADAIGGLNKSGTIGVGRVYVLFGRSSWPATLDVAPASNVTIFGRSGATDFPSKSLSTDLNGDGVQDLIVSARTGDTPVSGRQDAGDVFLFRGRASWPTSIDLQTQSADSRVYGADAFDYVGHVDQLAAGDVDTDGTNDLVIGVRAGDGRNNTEMSLGELRLIAPAGNWPATLDLRTGTREIVYGQRTGDRLGTLMSVADVNGDGRDDLISAIIQNDGIDGSRTDAGGAVVVLGRSPFPLDTDMALGQEDWRIIGARANDLTALRGVSDINDDGISEIVLANTDTTDPIVKSVWIVSPVDVDGDGFTQLADVCPLVADPLQLDANGDGRGDACALDWDGDGDPDTTDCKANSARAGRPAEVVGVTLTGRATTNLSWSANVTSDSYDILRGFVADLTTGSYGTCQNSRDPNLADTSFTEIEIPPAGNSFFFLVRGRDAQCGGAGSLGSSSSGTQRTIAATCQ